MSRTPATVLSLTFAIQPSGWALPTALTSVWAAFLQPMAAAWSAVEASMESMLPQVDPRAAVQLLPDWERMLGPDQCGRDLQGLTESQQQQLCYQRLTARGGGTPAYFIALAASLGETATIQEANWSRCGVMQCGAMMCTAQGNQFMWAVTLPSQDVTLFRTGASECGERLGSFTTSLAECPISHAAPAHTVVAFSYTG